MSSVQSYRAQIANKQNHWLLVYLGLAVIVHTAGAVALSVWRPGNLLNLATQITPEERPVPIEFVAIEPEQSSAQPPTQTERRAQTNSTAGGKANPELSIQTGDVPVANPSPLTSRASTPPRPPTSTTPRRSPSSSSNSSTNLSPASPPSPDPQPIPSVSPSPETPALLSTPDRSSQPTRSPIPSPLPASPQIASSPPETSVLPSVTTTQLGDPLTHAISIEGQGLSGRANPDRTAAGTGVDAMQDNLWGTYLTSLNRAVDQHWQRVSVAATRRTRIQFRVNRQGRLTDLQVLQSSGDTLADQAAIQAIRAAAPFAPLPQNASEEVLIVNFTFTQWLSPPP